MKTWALKPEMHVWLLFVYSSQSQHHLQPVTHTKKPKITCLRALRWPAWMAGTEPELTPARYKNK